MGDEVKITVIATGFKQQQMPQRRERMLAEATLPTVRYDVPGLNVPIRPRADAVKPMDAVKPTDAIKPAEAVKPAEAKVASEVDARPEVAEQALEAPVARAAAEAASIPAAAIPSAAVSAAAPPPVVAPVELVPVPASVFDDDFFKTPVPRFADATSARAQSSVSSVVKPTEPASAPIPIPVPIPDARHFTGVSDVQLVEVRKLAESSATGTPLARENPRENVVGADPVVRAGTFAAATLVETELAEPDELDIPAFLRRGNA
jgi:cell division protein FtsZ